MTVEQVKTHGVKRSNQWPKVRKAYLKLHPKCYVCLRTTKMNVHHVQPYHKFPELELNPKNFISLCENDKGGINCHLAFGHLGNFKSWNVNVREDVKIWREKILNRPL